MVLGADRSVCVRWGGGGSKKVSFLEALFHFGNFLITQPQPPPVSCPAFVSTIISTAGYKRSKGDDRGIQYGVKFTRDRRRWEGGEGR